MTKKEMWEKYKLKVSLYEWDEGMLINSYCSCCNKEFKTDDEYIVIVKEWHTNTINFRIDVDDDDFECICQKCFMGDLKRGKNG